MTPSTNCSPAKKIVYFTKYAIGYGWGYQTTVDVEHECILARYFGCGVTDPRLVLETRIREEIEMSHSKLDEYATAINHFDNTEGEDSDLRLMRELSQRLSMRMVLST